MKKLTALFLSLALLLILCACGAPNASSGNASSGDAYASWGDASPGDAYASWGNASSVTLTQAPATRPARFRSAQRPRPRTNRSSA